MASLLQATKITKRFGEKLLFRDINLFIDEGDKTAIVGINGCGKSTLLKILAQIESADEGLLSIKRDIKISFLHQDYKLDENKTVLETMLHEGSGVQKCIKEYESALLTADKELIQKCVDSMDNMNAWDYEVQVKQILDQLKISDYNQKIIELSGGQKKRIALASVLIEKPDLLILDEPTNHLDLEMIEWLEEYLSVSVTSLLMITHDRYFLDRVCNKIIEIDNQSLFTYEGNYSKFLEVKYLRNEAAEAGVTKARNLLRTELEWLRRMPKARTHKSKYRIEAADHLIEKANSIKINKPVEIKMQAARMGSKILEIENISKSFDQKLVVGDFSYIFAPNEKVGIIGNNGTGKTTFLNMITGKLHPDNGNISPGETVKFAYYTQDGIYFSDNDRPIDVVNKIAEVVKLSDGSLVSTSAFLNMFKFHQPMQYEQISKLSGGEKRRLYLCTVLMQQPNFLILDEPTNDLDILTLQVLEDYLLNFKGCVVIVSHDRFFIDRIVDHVFVFGTNGEIKDFPGNYTQYRLSDAYIDSPSKQTKTKHVVQKEKSVISSNPPKLSFKEKRELQTIEEELNKLQKEKFDIEEQISSGIATNEQIISSSIRLGKLIEQINGLEFRWLSLSEKVVD